MKDYIFEKIKDTTRHFKFGNVPVFQRDELTNNVDGQAVFRSIEDVIPSKFFNGLKGVEIGHPDRDWETGTFPNLKCRVVSLIFSKM